MKYRPGQLENKSRIVAENFRHRVSDYLIAAGVAIQAAMTTVCQSLAISSRALPWPELAGAPGAAAGSSRGGAGQ